MSEHRMSRAQLRCVIESRERTIRRLQRSVRSLRGTITRLKRR